MFWGDIVEAGEGGGGGLGEGRGESGGEEDEWYAGLRSIEFAVRYSYRHKTIVRRFHNILTMTDVRSDGMRMSVFGGDTWTRS